MLAVARSDILVTLHILAGVVALWLLTLVPVAVAAGSFTADSTDPRAHPWGSGHSAEVGSGLTGISLLFGLVCGLALSTVLSKLEEEEEVAEKELDAEDEAPEIVSLEEADDEAKGGSDDIPDLGDDDVEIDDEDDDTFLPDEEEEDDDVADIIGVGGEDDDEI